jgi:Transposase DDE domain
VGREFGRRGALRYRRKRNAHCRHLAEQVAAGESILADRLVALGHCQPRGGAPLNPLYRLSLREVVAARADHDELPYLLTNDRDRPAHEIARLYKERWEIEL